MTTIIRRAFSGEADLRAVAALVHQFPADNLHVADLPYRLSSWAFDYPDNVGLWVDADGQMLAWAVLQTPFWTLDRACHPGTRGPALRLYESVGFEVIRDILVYCKDYEGV